MQTNAIHLHSHHSTSGHAHALKVGNQFVTPTSKTSGNPDHDALVAQTQKWVSQTFYGELLKQMRNSPFKDKLFSGGRGGEAFNEMFDQKLADKMAKGSGHKLVDAIVNKIEARKAYGAATRMPGSHSGVHRTPKLRANTGAAQ